MPSSDNKEFGILVGNLFRARFPYLYISTWEEDRVLSIIRSIASDANIIRTTRQIFVWKLTTGMMQDKQGASDEADAQLKATDALKTLEFIEKYPEPAIFVLVDFHVYLGERGRPPDYQVIRKLRDLSPILRRSNKPKNIVLISPTVVLPNDLQKEVTIVDFELPSFEEIKSVLDEMINANRKSGKIVVDLDEEEAERLAKAALGLTLQEAENAFARAMVDDGRLDSSDIEVILEEKQQIIRKTGILEFIKSDLQMEDVGGLENLKRWLSKRNKSWQVSAQRYCIPAPKGVLITGVPGCGKSLIVKAISAAWQLPLLRLDVGKVFSGLVGSSEENMRQAIKTAEAIAPSILWIDEIEKGFSTVFSSGDSGTSTRVFGTFLTWMQEKTKPVFVAAAANNIHSLPAELLRKGRFDEIFFVDLPTRYERIDIFRVHLNKRLLDAKVLGDLLITDDFIANLADITEGFVGAEIEQAVISALFEAFAENRSLTSDDFVVAIKNTVPLSVTQAEQIHAIREWANVRAVAATRREDRTGYTQEVEKTDADVRVVRGGRTIDF
jgi:SpoVK/Ycf46/Vps4 family AAA+-type ATPase